MLVHLLPNVKRVFDHHFFGERTHCEDWLGRVTCARAHDPRFLAAGCEKQKGTPTPSNLRVLPHS